ncbi:heme o synthase [Candidatus Protochlamydia amoebophila]|uniref:Protoheme IX farnesyltransferase n=1 Tax=Candidatus Protochlamydia amoebophila TaxID=362787 RepID=A0A0C1JVY7_9BACT|nr:heme o synthase [Candidatus Protochlamydia amoebophila]KIC71412.1 Protoheme IX farnesyltransferase [Candidatus Protochlamydia amoebophila]
MINYYLLLTKPGIIFGNLVTVMAGFLLASKGQFQFGLFLSTILGLAFIMASGCVFNNYIDLEKDRLMKRTQNRPLVIGVIFEKQAIVFGLALAIVGAIILYFYTNFLTLVIAELGFIIYVFFYSIWKSRTVYGTAIGSLAGAVPPLVGYCAVSNQLDLGAFILFAMMVFWQMPHFFSIAIYRLQDYSAANIPVLPLKKGIQIAKIRILLYIISFTLTSSLLTFFHFTGSLYLILTIGLGLTWLLMGLRGLKTSNDQQWAQQMFRFSLVIISVLSLTIPFDLVN